MAAMFYSMEEAVRRLKTSREELKAMVEQGKLREFRDGLDRLFRIDEVEAIAPPRGYIAEDSTASRATDAPLSGPEITDAAASEAIAPEADEVEVGAREPERAELDVPVFDIRVELGMLDGEAADVPEHPIARKAAEAVAFEEDLPTEEADLTTEEEYLTVEEEVEPEPEPAISRPTPPTPRAPQIAYARLSAPKKSVWQWFVSGLRNDRPVAVVLLFIGLGGMLAGCAAIAYLLYKLL